MSKFWDGWFFACMVLSAIQSTTGVFTRKYGALIFVIGIVPWFIYWIRYDLWKD
jgi:hypothetical protein